MQRFKAARVWLVIGLGVIPFTPFPMAVQVGLAVADAVLLMALSAIARNPGTRLPGPDAGGTGPGEERAPLRPPAPAPIPGVERSAGHPDGEGD